MKDGEKSKNDRPRRKDQWAEQPGEDKKTYNITCSLCGAKAQVPFRPRGNKDVFCHRCFKFKREGVRKRREGNAPRLKHNTRVMFPIECAQCGREETLDYVPKGIGLDKILCSECVRTTYGDTSRWAEISEKKVDETQAEWSFDCVDCGRKDYLKFPPDPEEDYLCVRCYHMQESPTPGRLAGKKRLGRAVYIRKSDKEEKEDTREDSEE